MPSTASPSLTSEGIDSEGASDDHDHDRDGDGDRVQRWIDEQLLQHDPHLQHPHQHQHPPPHQQHQHQHQHQHQRQQRQRALTPTIGTVLLVVLTISALCYLFPSNISFRPPASPLSSRPPASPLPLPRPPLCFRVELDADQSELILVERPCEWLVQRPAMEECTWWLHYFWKGARGACARDDERRRRQ